MTVRQKKLAAKHGNPAEFARAFYEREVLEKRP